METSKIKAITVSVVGENKSFYRAGHRWTQAPQTLPMNDLTEDQLQALRAEPILKVTDTELPAASEFAQKTAETSMKLAEAVTAMKAVGKTAGAE